MYTAGQDKAGVLKCFFDLYNTQLNKDSTHKTSGDESVKCATSKTQVEQARAIVFIEDSSTQIEELHNTYSENQDYDVYSLHYIALKGDWLSLLGDGNQALLQEQSHQQWLKIKDDIMSRIYIE